MKISKQYAEHYIWGDQCDGWHLVKNKNLSIIHEGMAAKTVEVDHYHHHAQHFSLYYLEQQQSISTENELYYKKMKELKCLPLNHTKCVMIQGKR